jgi:hypothetical protein
MVKGKSIFTSFAFSTAYAPYAPYALKYERVKYERVKYERVKVVKTKAKGKGKSDDREFYSN